MRTFQALPATIGFLMQRQGINQSELARRSGLRAAQVSRYLSGEVVPKIPQLERMVEGLSLKMSSYYLVAERMQQLQKLVEYRPDGLRLRSDDEALHHLLEAALEARAALDRSPGQAPGHGGEGADGSGQDGTAAGRDEDPVSMLFEAQQLLQQSQRLTLKALHQLTTPPAG